MSRWVVLGFLLSLAVLVLTSAAAADDGAEAQPADAAAALKAQGDDAMNELRYQEALDFYTKAYDIDENPALLYNRGRALEALARYPEALDQITEFKTVAPDELKARVPQLDELIASLQSHVSTLTLTVNVDGARILLRSKQVGRSPMKHALRVNSGTAMLEVVAQGYKPYKHELSLPGGGKLTVDVKLETLATEGVLVVKASVPGAFVDIDGKRVGTSPVQVDLEAGQHRVEVHRKGYEPAETTAVVSAGKSTELEITLNELPGLVEKWWFWTGVGGVVLGGAVLTAALLTERSADKGDIPPGKVSAPLLSF